MPSRTLSRRAETRPGTLALAAALLLTLLTLVLAPRLPGQEVLQGQVVKGDTGVADVEVALHRVRSDTAGVIATTRSGPGGRFSLEIPDATGDEGFAVYFTTADHLGARYFGPALHPGDPRGDYRVEVFDTVRGAPAPGAVGVERRDVILLPDPAGGWEVNEIIHVANRDRVTYVPETGVPVWDMPLPAGAFSFEVGQGSLPAEAVQRMDDRVLLITALTPGTRDLFIRYRVPGGGRLSLPLAHNTDAMNLFVRQPSPAFEVDGLEPRGEVGAEGDRFLRFAGESLAPGAVALTWRATGESPIDARWAALLAGLLVLVIGGWIAVRRGRMQGAS
jgi:hypothetical protein